MDEKVAKKSDQNLCKKDHNPLTMVAFSSVFSHIAQVSPLP